MLRGSQTFPKALAIVFVIVVANYVLPILAFSGLDNDWEAYDNGYSHARSIMDGVAKNQSILSEGSVSVSKSASPQTLPKDAD